MAIGGIGIPNPQASSEASQVVSSNQVQQLDLAIDNLLADLKELSNELMQGQATSGTKGKVAQDSNATLVQTQKKMPEQQVQAKPQDQNLLDQGKDGAAEVVAATAAAIEEEKEKEVSFKRKRMSFQKKLEQMENLEEVFSDVKLEDPEQQAQLDKFFQNMQTLRQLQGKLTHLEHQEEQYEELLKKQEDQKKFQESVEEKNKTAKDEKKPSQPIEVKQVAPTELNEKKERAQKLEEILNDEEDSESLNG